MGKGKKKQKKEVDTKTKHCGKPTLVKSQKYNIFHLVLKLENSFSYSKRYRLDVISIKNGENGSLMNICTIKVKNYINGKSLLEQMNN